MDKKKQNEHTNEQGALLLLLLYAALGTRTSVENERQEEEGTSRAQNRCTSRR